MLYFLLTMVGFWVFLFWGAIALAIVQAVWETLTTPPVCTEKEEDMDKFTRWEVLGK